MSEAQARAGTASPFQAAILKDGVVSYAEYEKAVLATIECLRTSSSAITVTEPTSDDSGRLEYTFSVTSQSEAELNRLEPQLTKISADCTREFESDVRVVFDAQRALTPAERETVRPKVIDCLREHGIDIASSRASDREVFEALNKQTDNDSAPCFEQFRDYFIAPPR